MRLSPMAGDGVIPYGIVSIKTRSGKVLYERQGSGLGRVIAPENELQMTQLMVETVTTGTGKAARLDERPTRGQDGHDARISMTPGSSASPPIWSAACGSATTTTRPWCMPPAAACPRISFRRSWKTAEKELPVKPLAGAPAEDAPAAEPVQTSDAVPEQTPPAPVDPKKPDAFDRVLDSIFSGT